jgi:peptide/nickel transport system ATP-binding protein
MSVPEGVAHVSTLLDVQDLQVSFNYNGRWTPTIQSASFSLQRGRVLGLVGESGSGKTVTAMAVMGLINGVGGRVTAGSIHFDGRDVTNLGKKDWSDLRGKRLGMIFQQPMRALNPAFTVGEQIAEVIRRHNKVSRAEASKRAVEMLDSVHIADASNRAKSYPHQLSGGMCQRVMIAMALVNNPDLLIADEPTTALDVTVQKRVLDLIREVQVDRGIGVLFITHDLGVVAEMCDDVAVMYAGEVVERGAIDRVFECPVHPYTEGLLASVPRSGVTGRLGSIPGVVPPPYDMPTGCRFAPRCSYVVEGACTSRALDLHPSGTGRWSRCARVAELSLRGVV